MARKLQFIFIFTSAFLAYILLFSCNDSQKATKDLLFTDSLFSAFSEEYGANEAFERFAHPDVVFLQQKHQPVIGKRMLLEFLSERPDTCCTLIWRPDFAMVASSNDLGYTWGRYYQIARGFSNDTLRKGYYVTIWRKMRDGSWKFMLDTGTEGPSN